MSTTIHRVTLQEEFKNCPLCNYGGGFHVMFKREENGVRQLFVCPSCQEIFDLETERK